MARKRFDPLVAFGIPETGGGFVPTLGDVWFVNAAHTGAFGEGKAPDHPFETFQAALDKVGPNDTIYVAPGTYVGNWTTPTTAVAPNVKVIGVNGADVPSWEGGPIFSPTTSSSPIITAIAKGWRFSGINFKPGATSSGITFLTDATNRVRGCQVNDCLFWGGKYGIILQGLTAVSAPHSIGILRNKFANMTAAASRGIYVGGSSDPVYNCVIQDNVFESVYGCIDHATNSGIVGSLIRGNSFQRQGTYLHATMLVDVQATATPAVTGGNMICDNFFGCTKAEYEAGTGGTYVKANGYDTGAGNFCSDGIPAGIFKAT